MKETLINLYHPQKKVEETMASNNSKNKMSVIHSNATTVMSVSLVLLLVGMVAVLGMAGYRATQQLKENIGFDVVLHETASDDQITAIKRMWTTSPYVASVNYVSREQALMQWERETGEDLMEVLGVNPLSAEFEVKVKAQYACSDSLSRIAYSLKQVPGIDEVHMHNDMVDEINNGIRSVMLVMLVVAGVLLIISFALIANTVRLTVYSRRFLIHTMKLVGAKPGFIRRPIVMANVVNGVVASFIAMIVLGIAGYYVVEFEPGWAQLVAWRDLAIVGGALLLLGTVMCWVAATIAANRFIGLDYDELFTR
ncbi:MAG: cell division protein FtsX [Muribaculaceae bacterium]